VGEAGRVSWITQVFGNKHKSPPATKRDLEESERRIIVKLSELQEAINGVNTQLDKATKEIVDAFKDVTLTPEQTAAIDRLKAAAQALDDLNPDVPPPTA
jgi:anion-transporting  ArsA/GET3 family ATPase